MVKIAITILLMGLVYTYGAQAEDTNNAVVESIDANENKDAGSISTSDSSDDSKTDSSDSKSDSEVDLSKSENHEWLPQFPPMSRMPSMFPNFHGFRMPPMPRMPSLEDIQRMTPNDEFTKVYGSGASFSSSKKVVNGEVVEDKQYGKVVTNNNGEVQEKEFGNNE